VTSQEYGVRTFYVGLCDSLFLKKFAHLKCVINLQLKKKEFLL
jgi:hypothetical protein